MKKLKEPLQLSPIETQTSMGEPLRSEQRTGEVLPRVLSRVDLLTLFIAAVIFIPDAAVVQTTQTAGGITYLYWVIGTVTFLLPGAVVAGQLNRFMPANGSIYVWSHRALGPLWGFFAGFCAWIPGVLVLLTAGDFIRSLVQGIGQEISSSNASWLTEPWEQGVLILIVIVLVGGISLLPLPRVMRLARSVIALYGVGVLIVGLAGVVWFLSGHALQFSFNVSSVGSGTQNLALYGVIVLALLGVEVPLNMAAETRHPHAARLFLRWGPLLVLLAYLVSTFGVAAVVPPANAGDSNSTLVAVSVVFGAPASIAVGITFIGFFIITAVVYNLTFARILFVAALDHRLPSSLTRVSRSAVPFVASNVQILIVLLTAVAIYFLGPSLYPAANFSGKIFLVVEAATTVIWCISMVVLFLDLPILLHRFRDLLAQASGLLIAPRWVLYLCSILGVGASLVAIWSTLSSSWDSTLFSDTQWIIVNSIVVVLALAMGLLSSAYPRLLSSLDQQTAAARENARLYQELQVTYGRLRELDQLKDAFLTTASHELRTPLTIVQGYLELLREMEDASIDLRREFLEKACRACEELVLLQANIMDASRIEFDSATLDQSNILQENITLIEFDSATLDQSNILLKDICVTVVDLFEPWLLKERRSVAVEIAPDIVVLADETRLKQVLHNLLANALRYSLPETPIRLLATVEEGTDRAYIQVIDRGLGIPPDKQEVIFDKFVRLERDMLGDIRGSGLGLYITRQLVEAMQGTIRVESRGIPNEGSAFLFTLPLA